MDMQNLVDAMNHMGKVTRADYHLTLGKAIDAFEKYPKDAPVVFDVGGSPDDPHSYRGYYSDLAFEPTDPQVDEHKTVTEFLSELTESLNETFNGYKGGDFIMDKDTPLWMANWGECGRAIMGHYQEDSGRVILITKDEDDDE